MSALSRLRALWRQSTRGPELDRSLHTEAARDHRAGTWFDAFLQDVSEAWRALRSAPGLAIAALVTLAIGIGLNIAVFTVADATLFKGYRGVPDPSSLVFLTTYSTTGSGGRDCCVSALDVADWRAATTLEGLGAVADLRVALQVGDGQSETATATQVTPQTFGVLGVRPAVGRDFAATDAAAGAAPVAILSHDFWRARFGGDAGVIGRTLRVNGVVTTVVGVMPPRFAFPQYQQLWVPLRLSNDLLTRDARVLWFAVARLAGGRSIEDARAELETIGAQLEAAYPATNARTRPWVQTFRELFFGPRALATYGALWAAVGLVLLMACANLAHLLLSRATGRTREIAVRMALGAGRGRIVRQLLLETAMLASVGGALGFWMARVAVTGYEAVAAPPTQPWARQMLDYSLDARAVAYVLCVLVVTTLLCGLLPALRLADLDVLTALKDGGRGSAGPRTHHGLTSGMVVAQVALAVIVLSAAGVLLQSFLVAHRRDAGFDPTRVAVALSAALPHDRYPDTVTRRGFYDRLVNRISSLPDVRAVGLSDGLLGQGARRHTIDIDGQSRASDHSAPMARVLPVGEDYFGALGVAMWSGRSLREEDETSAELVAVISRGLAAALWPAGDAVGRQVRVRPERGEASPWRTVVGVAPDVRQSDPARAEADPVVYVPMRERPARGAWILVRSSRSAEELLAPMRQQLQAADPALPIWLGPFTLAEWMGGNNWRRGVYSGLFVLFAVMALLLAALGLFAIVASRVAERTQEIGVRIAIGASSREILGLVLRQALGPVTLGIGLGLWGAVSMNRLLSAQLVEIAPGDPTTLALVTVTLVVVAGLGSAIPARRALRVDPLVALRLE